MIATASVFARNEDCPVREIGDGLVILAPEGDMTHSLEDLGAFVWRQLDGRNDLNAVLDAITSEYDVARDVAEADLMAFITELATAGVIIKMN